MIMLNMNQEILSNMLGISISTLQRWLKKPKQMPLGMAAELSKILGISLEEFTK